MNLSKSTRKPGIRLVFRLFCLAALLSLALMGTARAQGLPPPESGGGVVQNEVLQSLQEQGSSDFIIVMSEQADLSPAHGMDWEQRGWFVYNTLKETAERSQAAARAVLDAQGVRYQSFIAGNEIYVYDGDPAALNGVLALGGIAEVIAPVQISLAAPFRLVQPAPLPQTELQSAIPWGIDYSGAPDFWASFGLRGEGIRVASIDTGAQYDHPALAGSYACAGGSPGDARCWRDATNVCLAGIPCDDQGHGTHTLGSMVGSDDPSLPYNAGMAPGAQWIACKGCAGSTCSGAHLSACADWLIAPDGNPNNRPQVVNNSWGGSSGGGNAWFRARVVAWRASGIFPVFAAGNYGANGCSSLVSPGDYPESFAVAAHDSGGRVAYFSSRGPASAALGAQPYTKPNLIAPGTGVISAEPGSQWGWRSGTSMAAPHVAGAVALLWSCAPALKGQMDATVQALQQTARTPPADLTCGTLPAGQGNFAYGYGYLDAWNAGQQFCPMGGIQGTVRTLAGNQPLPNAFVALTWIGAPWNTQTNPSGFYSKTVVASTYNVTAFAPGYCAASRQQVVTANDTVSVNLNLMECPNSLYLPVVRR
ncbi:MAG: S8 family serine peptidase [Chloroflexota bacterium]